MFGDLESQAGTGAGRALGRCLAMSFSRGCLAGNRACAKSAASTIARSSAVAVQLGLLSAPDHLHIHFISWGLNG
jgi:hypothetical protein